MNVFCTRESGHYIRMATINVATISGVHCSGQKVVAQGGHYIRSALYQRVSIQKGGI